MYVDARGLKCPLPIIRLTRAVKQLEAGDEVRIEADDPAFKPDVRAWCRKTGHTLVKLVDRDGFTLAVVRKESS